MTHLTILFPRLLACIIAVTVAWPAPAHEFWIAPERFQPAPDENIIAHFKNGENFTGINLAFFERRSIRFELAWDGQRIELMPRMGDLPALDHPAPGDGLVVVAHETAPSTISYREWEKFQAFADHKDFVGIRDRHRDRGLPETGFSESYTRHAKALVGIGSASGRDEVLGLETEFVALTNPYVDDVDAGFQVQLLYNGEPRVQAQVEVFDRDAEGIVNVTLHRTDDQGRVTIPVLSGHTYLLDAVVIRDGPEDAKHVWETLWAALTFYVP